MPEKLHRRYNGLTKELALERQEEILDIGEEDGVTRVEVVPEGNGKYTIFVYVNE